MPKKKTVKDESDSDGSDEGDGGQFVVEVITMARVTKKKKWEYRVKWAGYDSESDTWEPEENVASCDRLLKGFWSNIGLDNDDYPPGHTVRATPSWIKKEKERFRKEFGVVKKDSSDTESGGEKQPASSHKSKDAESNRKRKTKKKQKKEETMDKPSTSSGKRKVIVLSSDDGESSDERPLLKKVKKRHKSPSETTTDSSIKKPSMQKPRLTLRISAGQDKSQISQKGKEKETVTPMRAAGSPANERAGSLFSDSETSSQDMALREQVSAKHAQSLKEKPVEKSKALSKPSPILDKDKPTAKKITERRGVKPMPLPISSVSTGITTKARVAQGLHTPTTPGLSPALPNVSALKGLSFKKKTTAEGPSAQKVPSASSATAPPPLASLPPSVSRRGRESISVVEDVPFVQSPISAQDADRGSPFTTRSPVIQSPAESSTDPRRRPAPPPLPRSRPPPPPLPRNVAPEPTPPTPSTPADDAMAAANEFLNTIMPSELAAPMNEEAEERPLAVPLPRLYRQTSTSTATSDVKFQWTGDLFIDVNQDKAERLCNVKLSCITNPRPGGLRFNVCFRAADSLRLQKLHPVADLYLLLRACTTVQQLAKIEIQSDDDKEGFSAVLAYMQRSDLFTYSRAIMDDAPTGVIFIFPDTSLEICGLFQVPQEFRLKGTLLCALVPFKLTPSECLPLDYQEKNLPIGPTLDLPEKLTPAILHTFNILRLPRTLHDFLTKKPRKYYICHSSDGQRTPGYETSLLIDVLKKYNAVLATHKDYLNVVFVHAGSFDALRKLESLAERRRRELEVRFYVYGTHESVSPSRWGIREIYPIGGVVTFTPTALIKDPIGITNLVRKVDEHPLWTCFILPSVLAMAAKLVSQNASPLIQLDRGEFLFEELLKLIEEGSLAMTRAPPLKGQAKVKADAAREWIAQQMSILGKNSRELLEECIKSAADQYKHITEADIGGTIDQEVLRQMKSMQMQPAIMDDYRRFVVITSAGSDKYRDGIEFLPLSHFSFKDEFFPKEATEDRRPR
ncbi:hypothetical protein CERSUDRAFT_110243 [Gelatoporia subvermispora B]|uniref:Chromo domain-containing protein n=1 Tax=Ceriporiopsis subvermispora (strain B) TaxID=914234 RepID=M2RRY7_CERS8|nr:hypothetical protein CERSUDRAFT_110243 [Gelatoporia subvermispora B]